MLELKRAVGQLQKQVDQVNSKKQTLETNMSRLYEAAQAKVAEADRRLRAEHEPG